MIDRLLLCILAIMALRLGCTDVLGAQQSRAMIVVFRAQATFDDFREQYQPDEREHRNPTAWRYLSHDVLGAVQALEETLGFRADHVYSAAGVCCPPDRRAD